MTDARLKGEWLGRLRFDGLTDCAWRVFTSALMWSAEQGTDGDIPARYLKQLHPDGEQPSAFEELESAGLWRRTSSGFALVGWTDPLGQSTSEQVEKYKQNARERQRRHRERARDTDQPSGQSHGLTSVSATRDVPRDVTRDITGDVGIGIGKQQEKGATTFDAFWSVYPKHVNRDAALHEWESFDGDHSVLVAAAHRYAEALSDVRFATQPARWIRDGGWLDYAGLGDSGREQRERIAADVRVAKTVGLLPREAPDDHLPPEVATRLADYRAKQLAAA